MSLLSGIQLYPEAIAWSVVISSTIIMKEYDTTPLVSFHTLPVLREKYGSPDSSQPGDVELATNSSLFKEPPYRLSNSSGRFQWNRVTRGARHATGRSPSAAYLGQAEAGLHTLYGTEPKHADPEDPPEVGFS
ncbi:hypothetical protein ASPCAL12533 [Aspergillus calidoustus]|uniref:Uncharacterized protein n=1 Tax=Aspergillus calidoustus TaxID=454130 RepID=A0A0U4ZIJ2_ASPCI|nr:hypothetical protein ASPCAL12533 [Aspergillus calidoustus]